MNGLLSSDEQKVLFAFMEFFNRSDKQIFNDPNKPPTLFADAAIDIPITDYRHHIQEYIKKGETVRITSSSRWGNLGVTRQLDNPRHREILILSNSGELKNFRENPEFMELSVEQAA